MSPQPNIPSSQGQAAPEPLIRTMQKDIEALSGEEQQTPAPKADLPPVPNAPVPDIPSDEVSAPPADLPIPPEPPEIPVPTPEPEAPKPAPDIPMPSAQTPPDFPAEDEAPANIPIGDLDNNEPTADTPQAPETPLPDSMTQDKEEDQAAKEAEETAQEKQAAVERMRRSEEEEIAPKEFAEAMTQDKATLEEQRKKVEELTNAKPEKPGRLKLIISIIAIVSIVLIIGGSLYWWFFIREPDDTPPTGTHLACQDLQCVEVQGEGANLCQVDSDCGPTIQPPTALIHIDETETINVSEDETDTIYNKLVSAATKSQSNGTIRRVLVRVNGAEAKYLTLDELIQSLGITLPFTGGSAADYTLIFYSQAEGNRLGIIINTAIAGSTTEELRQILRGQEAVMKDTLKPLFLGAAAPDPASAEFLDNTYNEAAVRYLNFPDPSLTYDYAIVGNKFIITTSRDSIYAVIDKIAEEPPEESNNIIENSYNEAQNKAKAAIIKTNLAQLRSVAEIIFVENGFEIGYSTICQDGELNTEDPSQGDSISVIKNDIAENNGQQTVVCHANSEKYCVKSPLPTDEIWCVDSNAHNTTAETEACSAENISCSL